MQIQHHYLISGFNECCQISWRDTHEADELAPGSLVLCSLKFHLTKERFLPLTYITHLWTSFCVAPVGKRIPRACSPLTPSGSLPASYSSLQLLFLITEAEDNKFCRDSISAGVSAWLGCHPGLLDLGWKYSTAPLPTWRHFLIYQCNIFKTSLLPPLSHLPWADSWPQFWEVIRAPDVWKLTVFLHRTGTGVLLNVIAKVVYKD